MTHTRYQFCAVACLLVLATACRAATHFEAHLSVPPQPRPWLAAAYIDIGSIAELAGAPALPDPASFSVTGPGGAAAPMVWFTPVAGAESSGYISWVQPGADGDTYQPVTLDFATVTSPGRFMPANPISCLYINPGLEHDDNGDGKPDAWGLHTHVGVTWADDPYREGKCIQMPDLSEEEGRNSTAQASPAFNVAPGEVYRIALDVASETDDRGYADRGTLLANCSFYYYDADGTYLSRDTVAQVAPGVFPWKTISGTATVPQGAVTGRLQLYAYAKSGHVYFDNVIITPRSLPEVQVAQVDGQTISLRANDVRVRKFDFGPPTSSVFQTYSRIGLEDVYSAEVGYGWVNNPASGVAPVRAMPDDLTRDLISTRGNPYFRVDLPDGAYTLWMIIGDSATGATIYPIYPEQSMSVGDTVLYEQRIDGQTFYEQIYFKHFENDFDPSVDVFETYLNDKFSIIERNVEVAGGRVVLRISGVPLAAMVIYPTEIEQAMRRELAQDEARRRREVTVKYCPQPTDGEPEGVTGPLVAYPEHNSTVVVPTSRPSAEQIGRPVRIWAARGQTEAGQIVVWPREDLRELAVNLDPLIDAETGATIAPDDVGVHTVRYDTCPVRTPDATVGYQARPRVLMPHEPLSLAAGLTKAFWLSVRIGETAQPGVYRSVATLVSAGNEPVTLPIEVRVLDITLPKTPIPYGWYYFGQEYIYHYYWSKLLRDDYTYERAWRLVEQDLQFMKDHGAYSCAPGYELRAFLTKDADNHISLPEVTTMSEFMDRYRDAGGMYPCPWYAFQAIIGRYMESTYGAGEQWSDTWQRNVFYTVDHYERQRAERDWPEIIYYQSDELSNYGPDGGRKGLRLSEVMRQYPGRAGLRTCASLNGPHESDYSTTVDIAIPNHAFPITEESIAKIRDAGKELWLYNVGNSRFSYGMYVWRTGARGRLQWHFRYTNSDPYNEFDTPSATYTLGGIGPDGPLMTLQSEQARAGIDDYRYIHALEQLIDRAADGDAAAREAAVEARRDLDELQAQINVDTRVYLGTIDPMSAGGPTAGEVTEPAVLDKYRYLIATHILKLQGAMK